MSKTSDPNRKALGKGLSAFLPSRAAAPPDAPAGPPTVPPPVISEVPPLVDVDLIDPNPLQPRKTFAEESLDELAESIRENGMIQPLIVQRQGERYELIAGERRLRAAVRAGWTSVPVVVRDTVDEKRLVLALIENVQREDLNPIETAQALEQLTQLHGWSHEELGGHTGKDRSTITNLLRLLRLPPAAQQLLAEGRLSMGHARALLGLTSPAAQELVAWRIADEGLSVRQVERLVQAETAPSKPEKLAPAVDPNVRAATDTLERSLGTRVRIVAKAGNRGRIEIEYHSAEELDRLYETLTR